MELPERIGRYRVREVIGAGGFATVYRAHDDRLDAPVAVKVLAENHCLDPDVRERFLQEGRILRHIGSPHVVTVHDLGETDRGQPYLVLDHADRGDLARRVAERRSAGWQPSREDVLAVAEALADALVAVHAADVVHRDLAPRNLLLRSTRTPGTGTATGVLDADERLVLADLGLSKDLATASGLTVAAGTAGFSPPEQQGGPGVVDARADLWAASAVVLWLLLDRPPDGDAWRSDLATAGWPPALVDALEAGMAPEPADRPADAATWLAALRGALTPPPPQPAPVVATAAAPDAAAGAGGRTRQHARALLLTALAALVAGLALGWLGSRVLDDDSPGGGEVTELGDGEVRVDAGDGDRTVTITGPREVPVGETAAFEVDSGAGIEHWVWIGPDGAVHPGVDALEVATSSPGRATVRLVGVDSDGGTVLATLALRVVDR